MIYSRKKYWHHIGMISYLLLFCYAKSYSQDLIRNGSFEGQVPFYSKIPIDWNVCDAESTPDIQPISSDKPSHLGKTYLGLVARVKSEGKPDWEGSTESIHQILSDTLLSNHTYRLSLYLMYDPEHKPSIPFKVGPTYLKFFLGKFGDCTDGRLVWQSPLIDHQNWQRYDIVFTAECDESIVILKSAIGDKAFALDYIMIDDVNLIDVTIGKVKPLNCDSLRTVIDTVAAPGSDLNEPCRVYIPNVFDAKADAPNNTFKIVPDCFILSFDMQIFDRWGNKCYETKNENSGWNGTTFGSNQALPGLYIYKIAMSFLDEKGKEKSKSWTGTVNFLK